MGENLMEFRCLILSVRLFVLTASATDITGKWIAQATGIPFSFGNCDACRLLF
jgi:hypothetical protein